VAIEQAGLPAAEPVLVEQDEVEEARDGRLAIGEQDRVVQLARLVDNTRLVLRRYRGQRTAIVLAAVVITTLVGRRDGLKTVLDVPDRHAAFTRHRLRRRLE